MNKPQPNDDGLSLVELLVYIVVLGILMVGITAIFINIWKAQASVTSQTQATTRGQLVSSEIEKAMRNAIAFDISHGGTVLEVNTSFAGNRKCQAFALTTSGLAMTISASPTSSDPGSWPIWQNRVAAVTRVPAFAAIGANGVAYTFNATSDSAPVRFTGDTFTRNQELGPWEGCWRE